MFVADCDYGATRMVVCRSDDGSFSHTFGCTHQTSCYPTGVAVDGKGNVFVTNQEDNDVQVLSRSGSITSTFGSRGASDGKFSSPVDVVLAPSSNEIIVTDTANSRIQVGACKRGNVSYVLLAGIRSEPKFLAQIWQ